jgi:hypothetical protein
VYAYLSAWPAKAMHQPGGHCTGSLVGMTMRCTSRADTVQFANKVHERSRRCRSVVVIGQCDLSKQVAFVPIFSIQVAHDQRRNQRRNQRPSARGRLEDVPAIRWLGAVGYVLDGWRSRLTRIHGRPDTKDGHSTIAAQWAHVRDNNAGQASRGHWLAGVGHGSPEPPAPFSRCCSTISPSLEA